MVSLDHTFDDDDSTHSLHFIQSDSPNPENHMINQQKVLIMRDVVSKLKPRYRRLVELATSMNFPMKKSHRS